MNIGITLTSSLHVGQEYIELTRQVARTLAEQSHTIVYGGTAYGMMLELADAYKQAGGQKLIGVMSDDLAAVTKGYKAYDGLDEQYVFKTIGERKDTINRLSDAILALPGGYGTIEELVTVAGGKINKLFDKPIAMYNYKGFYNTLISFFDELESKSFSKIKWSEAVFVSENLGDILKHYSNYSAQILADKFV